MEAYAENEEIPAENPAFGLLQKGTVIEFEHRATRVVVKAKVQSFRDTADHRGASDEPSGDRYISRNFSWYPGVPTSRFEPESPS